MEKELNDLVNEMFRKWFSNNGKRDFKYYELFTKVNKLHHNIPIIKSDYVKDLELASIMSFIERQFQMPMLEINIKNWVKEDTNNEFILTIYNRISNLRSI